MTILLLVLGALALFLTAVVVGLKVAKRAPSFSRVVLVEIHGQWVERSIRVYLYHWLPKLMRAFGVTIDDCAFLRGGPPERWPNLPGWKPGRVVMQRWQVAHELSHFADQEREDSGGQGTWLSDLIYYWKGTVHRLVHRWSKREEEIRAMDREVSIADGTSTVLRADWLKTWFPDSYDRDLYR